MPLALVWGWMQDDLGFELLGAFVGLLLVLTGRSLASRDAS